LHNAQHGILLAPPSSSQMGSSGSKPASPKKNIPPTNNVRYTNIDDDDDLWLARQVTLSEKYPPLTPDGQTTNTNQNPTVETRSPTTGQTEPNTPNTSHASSSTLGMGLSERHGESSSAGSWFFPWKLTGMNSNDDNCRTIPTDGPHRENQERTAVLRCG
jgi:hypothetical protein